MNIVHGFCFYKWYPLIYVHYQKLLCMPCCFDFTDHYSREYNRSEEDAKIYNVSADCHVFFFLKETMELRVIHSISIPVPLCLFHSLITT